MFAPMRSLGKLFPSSEISLELNSSVRLKELLLRLANLFSLAPDYVGIRLEGSFLRRFRDDFHLRTFNNHKFQGVQDSGRKGYFKSRIWIDGPGTSTGDRQ